MANPVTWFEIMGEDSARLQKFYRDTFNWKMTPPVKDMGNYSMLEGHEPGIGGGLGQAEPGTGARVSIYIEVDDPQKYLDRAIANGGRLMMPVVNVTPTTTIAIFADPAGNATGLMKANPRPAASSAPSTRAASSRTARPRVKAATARSKKTATRGRKTAAKRTTKRAKRR
jgi:predicted enzyme related to lactoylglutathione lyase